MKKYLAIVLAAVAFDAGYIYITSKLIGLSGCSGFGCIGSGLLATFGLAIVAPIFFGIAVARIVKNPPGQPNRKLAVISSAIFFVIVAVYFGGMIIYDKRAQRIRCQEDQERVLTLYREHPEQFKGPPYITPCE